MDEVLSSANGIAGDYYAQQQRLVSAQAQRFARALSGVDLAAANPSAVRDLVAPDVLQERVDLVEVYRVSTSSEARPPLVPVARRRRAVDSARVFARVGGPARRAGGRERQRGARGRAAVRRRRADSHGGADPLVARPAPCAAWWSPAST